MHEHRRRGRRTRGRRLDDVHVRTQLTTTGEYTNVATVEGNKKPKESNEVVVEVPAAPGFTVEKLQRISG